MKKITVTKAWMADLETAAAHYRLRETNEYEWVKQDCRNRMAEMGPWITRQAEWIKAGCPASAPQCGREIEVISV